jgi:hypothetical protein
MYGRCCSGARSQVDERTAKIRFNITEHASTVEQGLTDVCASIRLLNLSRGASHVAEENAIYRLQWLPSLSSEESEGRR